MEVRSPPGPVFPTIRRVELVPATSVMVRMPVSAEKLALKMAAGQHRSSKVST
jgi:hypothetical protein